MDKHPNMQQHGARTDWSMRQFVDEIKAAKAAGTDRRELRVRMYQRGVPNDVRFRILGC
ncbi:hypothetical protein [Azoarcus sp. DD4]|uniref:hypothetical protein n=1 Tax=Azoarcus sp. DD4 TaxID=2027405 RepID=UPI00143DB36C|nr:hypothetical protein [Azoarcus sp. DD4]